MFSDCVGSVNKSALCRHPLSSTGDFRGGVNLRAPSRAPAGGLRRAPSAPLQYAPFPDVSVWYVWHTGAKQSDASERTLTQADLSEFSNIRHSHVKERSLATRALLRRALSKAVGGEIAPSEWAFERGAHGKPALAPAFPRLHFSCSHTHSASAVAVSRLHPVGIDIESSFLTFEDPRLLEDYFSQGELEAIERLPEHRRAMARVRLWTLKEAVAKMLGTGLALDISELEFDAEHDRLKSASESDIEFSGMRLATWSFTNQPQPLSVALAVNN